VAGWISLGKALPKVIPRGKEKNHQLLCNYQRLQSFAGRWKKLGVRNQPILNPSGVIAGIGKNLSIPKEASLLPEGLLVLYKSWDFN